MSLMGIYPTAEEVRVQYVINSDREQGRGAEKKSYCIQHKQAVFSWT